MTLNIREAGIEAQRKVVAEMADNKGQVPVYDWAPGFETNELTIKEMLGTDSGAREFIEKVTFEAYSGRQDVPLLYGAIYDSQTDPNFPKVMTVEAFGPLQVVFLEHFEGGEVKFGKMGPGTRKTVEFATYAAGVEYNEDIVEYNETWKVSEIGVAFGEAFNHLLNHLALSPIVDGTYASGGAVAAKYEAQKGDVANAVAPIAQSIAFNTDIKTTLRDALQVLPGGTLLLINPFDRIRIEQAIASDMQTDLTPGPVKSRFNPGDLLEYSGAKFTVGKINYTYPGVDQGEAFLVSTTKKNFKEYVKHDLRVDSDDGDLSRLILAQVVGRSRRAVLAAIGGSDGAVKLALQ